MEKKRNASRCFLTAGFMIFAALMAFAGDVKVIANVSVQSDTISAAELKGIFLIQRRTLKGSSVTPVLEKSGAAHEAFLSQFLGRGAEEMETYYQGIVFTGKGAMPKQLDSDADMVAYVSKTRGAIGYVSKSTNTEGVKTLVVVSDERQKERKLLIRVEPDYPEALQRLGIGGTVRLGLIISPKGTVENVMVLGGNPILGEAAANAAKQWVYSPAPLQTTIEVSIPFKPRP